MKRAVLYPRVSTANQEREPREIAGQMGRDVIKVYHLLRTIKRPDHQEPTKRPGHGPDATVQGASLPR
jgi:hypothetical protein